MVPEGWCAVRFDDVMKLEYGKNLPSRDRRKGMVRVFGSSGAIDLHDEPLVEGPGVILGRKGSIGAVTWSDEAFWPIDTTYFVDPDQRLDLRFLYHTLTFRDLESLNRATGVPGLNRDDVGALPLLLPPLPEQQGIATILSSVDDTIEATRKVIEQARRVKRGLLETLMTRGIGHFRFKRTEIGEVPEAWDVESLGHLAMTPITYGVVQPGPHADDGIRFIRGGDFPEGFILIDELRTITRKVHEQYARTILQSGDVLLSLVGKPGSSAVVQEELKGANIARQVALIRPKRLTDPEFLHYYLSSPSTRRRLLAYSIGSVQQVINLRDVREFLIPVPALAEQQRIVERVRALDSGIKESHRATERLQKLKRGLMQDLLTGRVRVQPD